MIKNLLLTACTLVLLSVAASAQVDTVQRWTKEYRDNFISDCAGTAVQSLGDSAQRYCECMAFQLETIYPNSKDVDQLTDEDLQKPALQKMVRECLSFSPWPKAERTSFVEGCVKNAAQLGEEKAKSYCDCMLQKVMFKFPSPTDAETKITAELLQRPEWKRVILGCLD